MRLTENSLTSGDDFAFEEFGIEATNVEEVLAEAEHQDMTLTETVDANVVRTNVVLEMTVTERRSKFHPDTGAPNES